jgi:hypothetical protein
MESLGYESDSSSRELARAVYDISQTYFRATKGSPPFHPVLEFRRDRFLRGGDHSSFNQEGFAAVRFTEWREDFNHQHQNVRTENGVEYGDLPKFVDYEYVAHVAALNAATLATLASAPPAPVEVRVVTKNLDNHSTLEWKDGPGATAGTRYEIVWRELAFPVWQFSLTVPEGEHRSTLPVSKDNVIFGVRAVDRAGHRSPAVAPLPER